MRVEERTEFDERVKHLRNAFPKIKEIKLLEYKEDIVQLNVVDTDYNEQNMIFYDVILCIGSTVINVSATSVESIMKIIMRDYMELDYCGKIGYLV